MELQPLGVLSSAAAAPWKCKISVDDSLVALHRGGGGVSCFEFDKMNKDVAYTYKRSSEESQDDTDSSSSSLLFVWSGQPNEDDDDNQPSKRLKPLCTTFVKYVYQIYIQFCDPAQTCM